VETLTPEQQFHSYKSAPEQAGKYEWVVELLDVMLRRSAREMVNTPSKALHTGK